MFLPIPSTILTIFWLINGKSFSRLDSNPGPMVSEVTALSTVRQPQIYSYKMQREQDLTIKLISIRLSCLHLSWKFNID